MTKYGYQETSGNSLKIKNPFCSVSQNSFLCIEEFKKKRKYTCKAFIKYEQSWHLL